MVPEELTKKGWLELEQGHAAEDEAREKNAVGEENEQESPPEEFREAEAFAYFSHLNV